MKIVSIQYILLVFIFLSGGHAWSVENTSKKPDPSPDQSTEKTNDKIEELKNKIKKTPRNLKLVIELAQEFYNIGDYEKTTLLMWKQIEKIDRNALLLTIRAHEKKKEWDQVLKVTLVMLSRDAKDKEALFYQGRSYLAQRKDNQKAFNKEKETQAAEVLKKAIEIDPKYQEAYEEFAKIYDVKKGVNYYELRLWYQGMVEKLGEKPEFLAKLCEIDTLDGVNESAIKYCEKAIQMDPLNATNFVYLGRVQKNIGESEKSHKTLKEAAEKFQKSTLAQETYAKLLDEDKNYIESFKVYEQCIATDKKNETCLVSAAYAGAQIQKLEKSLEYIKAACQINRSHSVDARKIAAQLKQSQKADWMEKFEHAAEWCSNI